MTKADATRTHIIQQAADLFNQKGYAGSSMADIMAATGLKKGGIYNHFASKDELAIAAFDFAVDQVSRCYREAVRRNRGAIARLQALVHTFTTTPDTVSLKGGCPILNTAVESDDTHPILRQRTQHAVDRWHHLIQRVVTLGIKAGDLRDDCDPAQIATVLIATLEGAMMMTKLYGDRQYLQQVEAYLIAYIDSLRRETKSP